MSTEADQRERIVIIAGMPRAATTFLYHTLAHHPRAWVPPRKELEFFSLNHERGNDWYFGFFEGAAPDQVGFDISPIYFMDADVPDRIKAFNPNAKVVLMIRDPVEFVVSFYAQRLGSMYQPMAFEEFLSGYTYSKDGQTVRFVFDDGRMEETIERFRRTFGKNLLLCSYDQVQADPVPVLQAIEAFAGLPPYFNASNVENVRVNASDQKNIVWLNRLMHYKWFADLVVKLVPKRVILGARYWLQAQKNTGGEDAAKSREKNERRAVAAARMSSDRDYVENLFRTAKIVSGTGEPVST